MSPTKSTPAAVADHSEVPGYLRQTLKSTKFMIFFAFYIGFGTLMVNFDLGYGTSVLQMQGFLSSFGSCSMVPNPVTGTLVNKCTMTALAQSMVSISTLFEALGCATSVFPAYFLGRRGTIQLGCAVTIIGASGQLGTDGNYVAYNVCKCVSCLGIGFVLASCPLYAVEVCAPQKRGALASLINIGLGWGIFLAAAICLGSSQIASAWSWKIPVILQIPFALMYGLGILIFPESPRWLMIKGREEVARQAFGKFYAKEPYSGEITEQIREVQIYIEFEKSLSSTTSWTEIFHHTYIRRTLLTILIAVSTGLSGVTFVVHYAVVFLSGVGISNPFLISFCVSACGVAGSLVGPFFVEYFGRRFSQIFGFSGISACMLIFAAVASGLGISTLSAQNVLVAFLCIFFFIFSMCCSSCSWTLMAEIHSVRLRTYGTAFGTMIASILQFATTFWTPYMINPTAGNLGPNVGYFYFGLNTLSAILLFFLLPETGRLPLEQIDDYFQSKRPAWKTSLGRNKKIAAGEIFDVAPEEHSAARQAADIKLGSEVCQTATE